ncbi:histidinol-phosphate transaminase [Zygosaccharomyces mellis]|uniref:histidinol-phosphate transaminase n=1 Tax=Zygosaccharomyces mellis TaxID=42258 RepID=A0A4C2E3U6_9SACH|nr:histidinol-phosphate transaminase [Zygosaccharomyces mellis]
MTFDLAKIIRPKIYNLEPYRCARDDFKDGILLDANENPYGPTQPGLKESGLNRYPDPHQIEFKTAMAEFRNGENHDYKGLPHPLAAENLCLGVGSDESIDAIIRACCVPAKEKILVLPPTYSMYSVCAHVNDIEVVECPLITDDNSFQANTDEVIRTVQRDPSIKLVFITSPGNPTGAKVETSRIEKILQNWDRGMVVVDEAYIDFCGGSTAPLVTKYPNLCVLQTLSKSFGLAGIRLGITFASKEMARVLNSMKAPYNISSLTSEYALNAIRPDNLKIMKQRANENEMEQNRLVKELTSLPNVHKEPVGGLDTNFILLKVGSGDGDNDLAKKLYYKLATESGVVVRYRGSELGCTGCLRITVGTKEENDTLVKEFAKLLSQLTSN